MYGELTIWIKVIPKYLLLKLKNWLIFGWFEPGARLLSFKKKIKHQSFSGLLVNLQIKYKEQNKFIIFHSNYKKVEKQPKHNL